MASGDKYQIPANISVSIFMICIIINILILINDYTSEATMVNITAIMVHKVNSMGYVTAHLNPLTANRDYSGFKSVLRADQITVIGN